VDGHDVWMIQRRCRPGFLQEPCPSLRIVAHRRWEHFQSHKPIELQVSRLVNHTHPTLAQLVDDLIVPDPLTDHACRNAQLITLRH